MAQLVEQLIRNQQVAGSSPASSSNLKGSKPQGFGSFLLFSELAGASCVCTFWEMYHVCTHPWQYMYVGMRP